MEGAYNILLNEEYQDILINEFIDIMKRQGYLGGNLIFDFLNEINQTLHQNLVKKIANRFQLEGFLLFITINYKTQEVDNTISIDKINYSNLSAYANGIIFLQFVWGADYGPPGPVINNNNLRAIIDYAASNVSPDKIIIGNPVLGFDWKLPYISNETHASSLSINSALDLAYDVGAVIQFDEDSQTPYYYYNEFIFGYPAQHIVWFIDARSIDALNKLIIDYNLAGSGVWNIMVYYQQLWTIINANFDIVKLLY
jgi:spore germination protein